MYAIINIGGKQAKVRPGDRLDVERIKNAGDEVEFIPLLVVDEQGEAISGRDRLAALTVRAKVLGETRGPKVDVFKYKNKTGYRRSQGHRQTYTSIEVTAIGGGAGALSTDESDPTAGKTAGRQGTSDEKAAGEATAGKQTGAKDVVEEAPAQETSTDDAVAEPDEAEES